jgi:potassium efflux system protein
MLHRWLLHLALCLFVPFAAIAQTSEPIDYDLWKSVATRAETAVDGEAGTNEVFETLRMRIVNFRTKFAGARLLNLERIITLQSQFAALGPVPEGGIEPATIASQRREITQQLATLQAPVQVAEAAFSRADGLIGEIDTIIRARQADRLLTLGPSPVNPGNWGVALTDLSNAVNGLAAERRLFSDATAVKNLRETAPVILLLLGLAAVLLTRGRRWVLALDRYLRTFGRNGSEVWGFVLSFFAVIVPFLGVVALAFALVATRMLGLRGEELVSSLPVWAGLLFGARWLADCLFTREDEDPLIRISVERRRAARADIYMLSFVVVLRSILDTLLSFGTISDVTEPVLNFPLNVLAGVFLFRIGQVLRSASQAVVDDDGERKVTTFSRIMRLVGLAAVILSVVGPSMAAIGYGQAGDALVEPTILSLSVLGIVIVLQQFLADVYGWITGQGVAAREALVPVLVGFIILFSATPVLALIWGARIADLTELWSAFSKGVAVGDSRVSPSDFITFVVIFVSGYMITRLLQGALRNNVLPKTQIDKGGQNAIVSGIGYVGIFVAALMAITGAGIDLSSLAIVAGALSVGIGFGLQNIVSNFVSGIILLIERPISEGDWIEVGGKHGYVRAISVRSTRIETFDRTDVIVPNADLVSGTVTNYTRGNTIGRLIMNVGVAYGTDTKKVEGILREIAEAQPMVLVNPAPFILFSGFGSDSLDFEIRMILRDVNWSLTVKNDVNHQILARFVEEGIEIPFAQRDIWIKNPEALVGDS